MKNNIAQVQVRWLPLERKTLQNVQQKKEHKVAATMLSAYNHCKVEHMHKYLAYIYH